MTTLPDMTNGPSFSLGPRGLLNCEFMLQNNGQAPTRHGRPVELNTVGMPARSENACCQVNGEAAKVARKKFGNLFASGTWSCPNSASPRRSDSSHTAIVSLRHVRLGIQFSSAVKFISTRDGELFIRAGIHRAHAVTFGLMPNHGRRRSCGGDKGGEWRMSVGEIMVVGREAAEIPVAYDDQSYR
jgi:hypothetical protein